MELYTLDETFLREKVVDTYISSIWAERYSRAGDFQLILPATSKLVTQLKEGTFITEKDSDELMIIETQSIENDQVTVKGRTTEAFLDERFIYLAPPAQDWTINDRPGNILSKIVHDVAITGSAAVGGEDDAIPYLIVGSIDQTDPAITKKLAFGPAYGPMEEVAVAAKLGMKIFLSRADPFGYEMTFTAYKGIDRTSDQLENDLVRFSSAQDSLTNIKQVNSIAGYKTVVYVYPPSWSSSTAPVVVYAPGSDASARGFDRRVLVVQSSDISEDQITGSTTLLSLMTQAGKDALANNNYTKLVDGEVVPQPQFVYGKNYKLGDIIELVGQDGVIQKAQITEYIRSKDATGERAYPTVTVVD